MIFIQIAALHLPISTNIHNFEKLNNGEQTSPIIEQELK